MAMIADVPVEHAIATFRNARERLRNNSARSTETTRSRIADAQIDGAIAALNAAGEAEVLALLAEEQRLINADKPLTPRQRTRLLNVRRSLRGHTDRIRTAAGLEKSYGAF